MASVKGLKKDIDYLIGEVVSDCYMTVYFNPAKKELIIDLMEEAIALRNALFAQVNSTVEKHNPSLVKKHFAHVRRQMMEGVDELFVKLSDVCKSK